VHGLRVDDDSAEELLAVTGVGSRHCSGSGLGGAQGGNSGAGHDGSPTAGVAAAIECMQRARGRTQCCEEGKISSPWHCAHERIRMLHGGTLAAMVTVVDHCSD
jgi:hypothetical protein